MKRTRRIAAALGLLALPLFTGAWTLPQAQQQETEPSYAETEIANEDFDYRSSLSYNPDDDLKTEISLQMGPTSMYCKFEVEQAGLNGTDCVNYEFKVRSGPDYSIKIKTLFFWGNYYLVHGDEVLHGPVTVTSSGYNGTLWCDHGGVPSSPETSNKRWNCNFVAIALQIKSLTGMWYKEFVLNFYDGSSDTFYSYNYYQKKQTYIDMISAWGAW